MFPLQKKTDLIAAIALLFPVWDFAEPIKRSIEAHEFTDGEMEELYSIVMQAIHTVSETDREAIFSAINEKISHIQHREATTRNQEQDQAYILLETI